MSQPLVSVDVIALRMHEGQLEVALGKRLFTPHLGELALPGVLLAPGETIQDAMYRALETKTGIARRDVKASIQLGAFDGANRDPRGATISIAQLASVDAPSIWVPAFAPGQLPFDHNSILAAGRARAIEQLFVDLEFTRALLGEKFTIPSVMELYTQSNIPLPADAAHFKRWMSRRALLKEVGRHGRSAVYVWG